MQSLDRQYNIVAAAAFLNTTEAVIRLAITQGLIKAWRVAGRKDVVVYKSDLEPFLLGTKRLPG